LNETTIPILKHENPGRPKASDEKIIVGYQVATDFKRNDQMIELLLQKKG